MLDKKHIVPVPDGAIVKSDRVVLWTIQKVYMKDKQYNNDKRRMIGKTLEADREKMYPNEYTALKDITLFLSLPAASVRWNGYVLESYLRDYSKKFRLVQVSISNDDYYGVMLKSTSNLESYNDVAADMLAKNESWTDEKSALRCLVDAKFQQRAKNSNISAIVKAARQKRANI